MTTTLPRIQRIAAALAAAVILLVVAAAPRANAASSSDVPGANILLLIDKSGSMNVTDQDRIAVDAAKMFVDSLYMETLRNENERVNSANFRVGILAFSLNTVVMCEPMNIATAADMDKITGSIDNIRYEPVNTGATDVGRVVLQAAEHLHSLQDSSRKNVIVLFSDGYTALGEAAKQRSEQFLSDGIEMAKAMGCEIYTIGLNSGGSITEEGRARIREIANATQTGEGIAMPDADDASAEGRVNYLVTTSLKEIQSFYLSLFADLMREEPPKSAPKSLQDGWSDYDLEVEGDDVGWVKIYILSDGVIGDFEVRDPTGELANNLNTTHFRRGNGYVLLTLDQPMKGHWHIRALGDVTYNVRYLLISGMHIQMEVGNERGAEGTVRAAVLYGREAMEEFSYDEFSARCVLMRDGAEMHEIGLSPEKDALTGSFFFPSPGRFVVQLLLTLPGGQELRAEKEISVQLRDSGNFSPQVSVGQTKKWDFTELFLSDWPGLEMRISEVDVSPDGVAEATADGSVLALRGLRAGEADLVLRCVDSAGNTYRIPARASVGVSLLPYAALLIAAFAIVCAAAVFFKRSRRYVPGSFELVCVYGGVPMPPITIPASEVRGSSFTLYRLASLPVRNASAAGLSTAGKLYSVMEAHRQELCAPQYRIHLVERTGGAKGRERRGKTATYCYGEAKTGILNGGELFSYRGQDGSFSLRVAFIRT